MSQLTFKQKQEKYADMIVRIGAGLKEGQPVQISCPVSCADFGRIVAERAYKAGASEVVMNWLDIDFNKIRFQHVDVDVLKNPPEFLKTQKQWLVERGAAFIMIISADPQVYAGMDPVKLQVNGMATRMQLREINNKMPLYFCTQTAVAVPHPSWAAKVFPNDEHAMEKLWDMIFQSVRVGDFDIVEAWQKHQEALEKRSALLNGYHFKTLRYKNSLGTDFSVDLAEDHEWCGGAKTLENGAKYYANVPTEEVFTAPAKYSANGKLVATMPLVQGGEIVKDFWFELKDGEIVNYDAKEGKAALDALIHSGDEGSRYLGEVALVAHDSPISNLKTLFLNTLYDENASCHFAIGTTIPQTVKGGIGVTDEQLAAHGVNVSRVHVDFMVGSEDLNIVGITHDGKEVPLFRNGNWAI